jgi:hypothetical protein
MKLFMKLQWGGNLQGLENEKILGRKTPSCDLVRVAATRWEVGFTEIVKFPCKNWTKNFVM